MHFRNLTPHTIVIRPEEGPEVTIEPSGLVARFTEMGAAYWCPIRFGHVKAGYVGGGVVELPPALPGVTDLVSRLCLDNLTPEQLERSLAAPDTGPGSVIRNEAGQVEAVKRLLVRREGDTPSALWRRLSSQEVAGWLITSVHTSRDKAHIRQREALRGVAPRGPDLGPDSCWSEECLILPLGMEPSPDAKGHR